MYQTVQGDTWDILAKKIYGNERKADYLMKHNFRFLDYFIFPAGIFLETPELPEEQNQELPPWRN